MWFPPVPPRSNEEIREAADLFLQTHRWDGTLPVPIEEIVEIAVGLEIRPIRMLRAAFRIDGFLSVDLATIVVDEELLTRYVNRYRFTLAHEIGHFVLHPDQVRAVAGSSFGEWKHKAMAISPQDYSRMETQAYEFAGRVLVPRSALLESYQRAGKRAEEHGIDLAALEDAGLQIVAGWIAKQFAVSTAVVWRRLEREGLI